MDDMKQALGRLDKANDAHWTTQGEPKIESVSALLGRGTTRREIIEAAPKFTRESMDLSGLADGEKPRMDFTQPPITQKKEEPVAPPKARPEDVLRQAEEAKAKVDALSAEHKVLTDARKELDQEIQAKRIELDKAISQLPKEKEITHLKVQADISHYLESAHKIRQAKAEQMAQVEVALGVVRSPLDMAFRQRGGRKPGGR